MKTSNRQKLSSLLKAGFAAIPLLLVFLGGTLLLGMQTMAQLNDPQHNPNRGMRQNRQYGSVPKITGKVMDANGRPLENVSIRIRDRDQPGQVLVVRTDAQGVFIQSGLTGEFYEVEASLPRHRTERKVVSYGNSKGAKVSFVLLPLSGDPSTIAYKNPREEYTFRIQEARVALMGSNFPRALEIVEQYREQGAWDADFQVMEADLYRLQGDCESALKHYQKAEKILGDLTHAFLLFAKGECQLFLDDVSGAAQSWHRAVKLEPANWARRIQAGNMLLQAGDIEQARLVLLIDKPNPGSRAPLEAWELAFRLCQADQSKDCTAALEAAAYDEGVDLSSIQTKPSEVQPQK